MKYGEIIIASAAEMLSALLREKMGDLYRPGVVVVKNMIELHRQIKTATPRVVFIEHCFEGFGTDKCVYELTKKNRSLRVAVWTVSSLSTENAARFVVAGAESFLDMRTDTATVQKGISRILAGNGYCPADVEAAAEAVDYAPDYENALTGREKEILKLAVGMKSTEEIADILGIAYNTVKKHRANICIKCDGNTLMHFMRYGLRHGAIDPDDI